MEGRREIEREGEKRESVFMFMRDTHEVKAWEELLGLYENHRELNFLRAQNSDYQMVEWS